VRRNNDDLGSGGKVTYNLGSGGKVTYDLNGKASCGKTLTYNAASAL